MPRLRRWKKLQGRTQRKRQQGCRTPKGRSSACLRQVGCATCGEEGGHGIPAAARNVRCRAPAKGGTREETRSRAKARPLQSPQGGACLRRDLSRREGVRRVRRASGGPGGRECAENPGPDGRPCACCIRYSRKPGCGRNCVRSARVARRGRGTVRGRGCGGDSKSKRRVRDREWLCGAPRFSGNPWLRGQREEALPRLGRRHFWPGGSRGSARAGASRRGGRSCCVRASATPPAHRAGARPGAPVRWTNRDRERRTKPQSAGGACLRRGSGAGDRNRQRGPRRSGRDAGREHLQTASRGVWRLVFCLALVEVQEEVTSDEWRAK